MAAASCDIIPRICTAEVRGSTPLRSRSHDLRVDRFQGVRSEIVDERDEDDRDEECRLHQLFFRTMLSMMLATCSQSSIAVSSSS